MKFRQDFVTNSSSASYIICFARIEDMNKAKHIIEEYDISVLSAADVEDEMSYWGNYIGADWADACIYGVDKIIKEHPDDKYVIIEDYLDAYEYDLDDVVYNYNFDVNEQIGKITEENGFADIDCAEGEGRNG